MKNEKMDSSRSSVIGIIALILGIGFIAFVMFGRNGSDETVENDSDSQLTNVTVIENDSDPVEEDDGSGDDVPVEEEENVDEDIVDDTEPEVDVDIVDEEGRISLGEATSADNARVSSYNYSFEDGSLVFKWGVGGIEGNDVPKAVAYAQGDSIIVEFPDIVRDSVAKEEETMDLGNLLPELTWTPSEGSSSYEFKFKNGVGEFSLNPELDEDGNTFLVLVAEL